MSDAERRPEEILKDIVNSMVAVGGNGRLGAAAVRPLPEPSAVEEMVELLRQIFFFEHVGIRYSGEAEIRAHLGGLVERCYSLVSEQIARSFQHDCRQITAACDHCRIRGRQLALNLIEKFPEIREMLIEDVQAAYEGDPAAQGFDEIIFSYPFLLAITVHRVAHELYSQGMPLLPRLLSEHAHSRTGIDIHPGAKIGRRFFIDHGTGVVIGETTVIGDHVKMYQGSTLGALSFPRDACGALIRGVKRHPTIEDNVTIYAGATILGGDTVVGRGSVIGGGVWLTHSIPAGTKVINEAPRLRFKESGALVKDEVAGDYQI